MPGTLVAAVISCARDYRVEQSRSSTRPTRSGSVVVAKVEGDHPPLWPSREAMAIDDVPFTAP